MSRILNFLWLSVLLPMCLSAVEANVVNLTVTQRFPWNGKVDITFSLECADENARIRVAFQAHDDDCDAAVAMTTLSGDGIGKMLPPGGPYRVVWDSAADYPLGHSSSLAISASVEEITVEKEPEPLNVTKNYLVVNLNDGSYRETDSGPNLSSDTCRTSELWLRRIPSGAFYMGSPSSEVGRGNDETRHRVTLSKAYYMGVFEVTQKQYQFIMEGNPSEFAGDTRPVENVSYDDICGGISSTVADSFLGKLRTKTVRESGTGTKTFLAFDLPTEAQWEYACRAGKTTALNTGENLSAADNDRAMANAGRYSYNITDKKGGLSYTEHTKVGLYPANAWNLYDMHGNVAEWCKDFYGEYSNSSVTDPMGPESGSCNVIRGGHWNGSVGVFFSIENPRGHENFHSFYPVDAQFCRSASRNYLSPTYKGNYTGFRVCVILP